MLEKNDLCTDLKAPKSQKEGASSRYKQVPYCETLLFSKPEYQPMGAVPVSRPILAPIQEAIFPMVTFLSLLASHPVPRLGWVRRTQSLALYSGGHAGTLRDPGARDLVATLGTRHRAGLFLESHLL